MIPTKAYIGNTQLSAMMLNEVNLLHGDSGGVKDLVLYPCRSYLQNVDYSDNPEYTITEVYNYINDADGSSAFPKAVTLEFESATTSVTIYTDEQHTQVQQSVTFASATSVDIYNLIPNTNYYWEAGNGESGTFSTRGDVRWCYLQGCNNYRDLGGKETVDNKVVKYGRLYRGSEMNGEHGYHITESAILVARNVLGVGAELDFRNQGETDNDTPDDYSDDINSSALGDDIPYQKAPILAYSQIATTLTELKTAWDFILAQLRLGHGVCYHCWAGADRTGTISWLLLGLLKVKTDLMDKDYELTSFSRYGSNFNIRKRNDTTNMEFGTFVNDYIKSFTGDTLHEKIENFWLSIGVTSSEIAEFRMMMRE